MQVNVAGVAMTVLHRPARQPVRLRQLPSKPKIFSPTMMVALLLIYAGDFIKLVVLANNVQE
jgi:hypothetical protein